MYQTEAWATVAWIAAVADRPAARQQTQICPKKKGAAPRSAPPGGNCQKERSV